VNFFETQCRIVPKCTAERQQLTQLQVIYIRNLTVRIIVVRARFHTKVEPSWKNRKPNKIQNLPSFQPLLSDLGWQNFAIKPQLQYKLTYKLSEELTKN